jgi:hypothetical protein
MEKDYSMWVELGDLTQVLMAIMNRFKFFFTIQD